jgi:hypothetical protein
MIDTNFTLVSGTFADEQQLLSELDFFMVNTIGGWTRVKTVADTPTDKNITYYTDGSTSGTVYDRFWIRLRATAGNLRFNGLSNFDVTTDTDYDQFGGTTSSTELLVSASGYYWLAANQDAVHVLVDVGGFYYHGGFGQFISYHSPDYDPKPGYLFGQVTSLEPFSNGTRLAAYGPHSWGAHYSPTFSGTSRIYEASHPTSIAYGTPNARTGEPKLIEPVFFTDASSGAYEVRGEVPGLYMCGGTGLSPGGVVNITKDPATVSGTYLIHKSSDTYAWAIGPATVSGGT